MEQPVLEVTEVFNVTVDCQYHLGRRHCAVMRSRGPVSAGA
ncbi:hypothetical protein APX70_200100 [Pseudomonas syringae pv. maculicola]|uniref:Uncharacterized protein n=1 Tax=Pseudomonas syringae pv. maculicola TaxID=59511 RepID=A0A3M2V2R9_PSEYM|nr:hypothetical protein APX70_200100 [Pseudomonas syringae pv. maculicola]